MRLKKAKYIFYLFFCLTFVGQIVFSRERMIFPALRGDRDSVPGEHADTGRLTARPFVATPVADSLAVSGSQNDLPEVSGADSLVAGMDSLGAGTDTVRRDSVYHKPFLDDVISGKNQDSLVYDVLNKTVYVYEKGDVNYQNKNLKADYMRINMDSKEIYAYGREDTASKKTTRPEFTDGGNTYDMDTITYNITSGKARIKGVSTKDGEGILTGAKVKKMKDNTINIANGRYTTCDADHPHFYLAMTKAKTIPGKKVIVGPSYLVMEDVPIYFLGLPFGFFPTMSERNSGFIIPEYGEESVKGFFIRNGGYYFVFGDHMDAQITAGIYTMGSWEAAAASRYIKRYKYSGSFNLRFSKDILGEKGAADYMNMNNFNVQWSHSQDPKSNPNSTFSASVNFSTSGYNKYGSQTMNDYLNTQTNSSISYSKSWAGTPFSFSTNLQHSQNSQDTTVSLSLPNFVFNVGRIAPFQRREAMGKQRWYEKIYLTYTGSLANSVKVKEKDLFTDKMFREMKSGVNHVIPVSASLNILKYINISPSANYQERWYFKKIDREWDPENKQVVSDTTSGFYRVYDYRFSVGASTKVYGTYNFKKGAMIEAIRHTLTPTVSFGYTPDFGAEKFGYYKYVQTDEAGTMTRYSPYQDGMYGVPGSGRSASMSFSLQQTLEMKVRDRGQDTIRKLKVIDNLNISSSYNFLADSLNLAPFSINLRTNVLPNLGLNVSATLDPYQVDAQGRRINRFMIRDGKLGRLSNVSTSFGYSFPRNPRTSSSNNQPAINDIQSGGGVPPPEYSDFFAQPGFNELDPETKRRIMSSKYYNFDIPWQIGFNYSFSYSNTGIRKSVVQTLGFSGSLVITKNWGFTFNGGYDFQSKKITPGTFTLSRDLHCWQMSFTWVPIGFRKSWSFSINVKSATLKDLKYDRHSSYYDNLYDQ